jgi:hypothetical protein
LSARRAVIPERLEILFRGEYRERHLGSLQLRRFRTSLYLRSCQDNLPAALGALSPLL